MITKKVDDSEYLDYSPIVARPQIQWPGGARVAVWIVPNIELYEYMPSSSRYSDPWPRVPHPDVLGYSYRDYGNRVGFWRMLEVLDHHGVRATASLNVAVLEQLPEIRDAMVSRDWDYMSHGVYNTQFLFGYDEPAEREFYRLTKEVVRRHTGKTLRGMLGPSFTATPQTPRLMAEAGLSYYSDLFVDDQPFSMNVPSGRLVGVPYSRTLNDYFLFAFGEWAYEGDDLVQMCKDQLVALYGEAGGGGRVMCIALHPFLIGQPHRVQYLDELLGHVVGHDGVWVATGDEIAGWYLSQTSTEERGTSIEWPEASSTPALDRAGVSGRQAPMIKVGPTPPYAWSPIIDRPALQWPGGARLAVAVVVTLERMGWYPPADAVLPEVLRTGHGYPMAPNVSDLTQYEYGNRVGVFRVVDVLRDHGIPPTVAADALVLERAPFLVEYLGELGAEFIAHGISSERLITQALSETEEHAYLLETLDRCEAAIGARPRGWLGSEYSESSRTVRLLAALGVRFVCDWAADDQPFLMDDGAAPLVAVPVMVELDDVLTHVGRSIAMERFQRMIAEQFDRLYAESTQSGRLFVLNVHPWVSGHPFRMRYLSAALAHVARHSDVWFTTAGAIVDHALPQLPGFPPS
jgi:peptidoglycan/xylan/chitin deacetylase (PgdA/CDA1 family)